MRIHYEDKLSFFDLVESKQIIKYRAEYYTFVRENGQNNWMTDPDTLYIIEFGDYTQYLYILEGDTYIRTYTTGHEELDKYFPTYKMERLL